MSILPESDDGVMGQGDAGAHGGRPRGEVVTHGFHGRPLDQGKNSRGCQDGHVSRAEGRRGHLTGHRLFDYRGEAHAKDRATGIASPHPGYAMRCERQP